MESNLADEIARIEAELEADRQCREQQQQQQQLIQQQQQQAFKTMESASVFNTAASAEFNSFAPQRSRAFGQSVEHVIGQPQQQQQHIHQHPIAALQASGQPHQFSKDSDGRSVFVGNLPRGENGGPTTTPEELAQFFADCGQILNCTVLRDRTTGELKGTAYVEFASYTGMGKAIDTKNNTNFKGSTIIVTKKRSAFRPERARGGRGAAAAPGAGAGAYQAMMALMGMMAGGALAQRGGRGRGGRGRGATGGYTPSAGVFQPFQ